MAAVFRSRAFCSSSFGYFGHMWELYALWAFVPIYLGALDSGAGLGTASLSLWTFVIIGAGAVGCVAGGMASLKFGSARVASLQLAASAACCLLSPMAFGLPYPIVIAFLIFWGVVVVGDSPQFSALNARYAPASLVGSALTIANCIGFAVTILAIQLLNHAANRTGPQYMFLLLLPGPIFGLWALRRLLRGNPE
jgi:hypothetical protein